MAHVSEEQARAIIINAYPARDDAWYQVTQGISKGEGGYGNGWVNAVVDGHGKPYVDGVSDSGPYYNEGAGSNNWGATQGSGDAGSFRNLDHHANGAPYQGIFKKWSTPELGAKEFLDTLIRIMNKKQGQPLALSDGTVVTNPGEDALIPNEQGLISAEDVAFTMHAGGYFELAPEKYADGIFKHSQAVADALGEPMMVTRASLLASGSSGADDPYATSIKVTGILLLIWGGLQLLGKKIGL